MAVYYKFKSAKNYDSITVIDHFISVLNLKQRIVESKHMTRGTDFDLIVTNAQSNEEYADESMLIPKNTSVSVRRVPGLPRMPIVVPLAKPKVDDQLAESNSVRADPSMSNNSEALDYYDDFGDDVYATTPKVTARQSSILMQDSTPLRKAEEDSKIKAKIGSSGLDQGCGLQQPPQGYICHRCNIPGHYIQHCPTNGDPNFDIRKVKSPTGIPKSLRVSTPDSSSALANGTPTVNRADFEKEIGTLSSTRSIVNIPPELHCPLCNQVMKDAVFTSKCCYRSFCDKCIRDCIITKSMCYCKAENILADDLLPNPTVRDTINRIMDSCNSSTITDNGGSSVHVEVVDMESAPCLPTKIQSPAQSDVSNVDQTTPSKAEELNKKESVEVSKPTLVSARKRKRVIQSGVLAVEEAQQKPAAGDAGTDMGMQPIVDVYTGPSNFNPYWQGWQHQRGDNIGHFNSNRPQNFAYPSLIPSHPLQSQRDLAANFSDHCHSERERSRERFSVECDRDLDRERGRKSIHRLSDKDNHQERCYRLQNSREEWTDTGRRAHNHRIKC
ncbi:hypothetical protein KSS87_015317 [Heliosperma pusillum]|nr:hypothetical protein KSS87_015317 [Heliosperma pusillum]